MHTPSIFIEYTYSPLVICNGCAFTKFIQGKKRCLKFISQDLTFLQSSSIPSTFSSILNTDGASVKVREPSHIQLLICIPQENTNTPPTQTVEPVYMLCISKTACFSVNCAPLSLQFGWNEEPKRLTASKAIMNIPTWMGYFARWRVRCVSISEASEILVGCKRIEKENLR